MDRYQRTKAGDRVMVDGVIKAHDPGMTVKPVPLSAKEAAALPANPSAPLQHRNRAHNRLPAHLPGFC
jgi:hypothetical protein